MAVPDTNTFSLQDVIDAVEPTTNDLVDCIADALEIRYDNTYYTAPATSLLEFRNYGWGLPSINEGSRQDITTQLSGSGDSNLRQVFVDNGGTRLYVIDGPNQRIIQLSIASAHNVSSTISFVANSPDINVTSNSFTMSQDGTKAYVMNTLGNTITQYTISTPWDITTLNPTPADTYATGGGVATSSIQWEFDGTGFFFIRNDGFIVYVDRTANPWSLTGSGSATAYDAKPSPGSSERYGGIAKLTENGQDVYILGTTLGQIGDRLYRPLPQFSDREEIRPVRRFSDRVHAANNNNLYTMEISGSNPYTQEIVQWNTNITTP
jgi:hypothetical protein